jgi:oligoendopeptidase F
MPETPPRWDLTNVFPSLESPEYAAAVEGQSAQLADLEDFFTNRLPQASPETLPDLTGEVIDRLNAAFDLAGTLRPYLMSFVATDSRDQRAMRKNSEYDQLAVRLRKIGVQFQAWVGSLGDELERLILANPTAAAHAFNLREAAQQARFLMSPVEEDLAAELSLSGSSAWGKLQGTVTSQLSAEFEIEGKVQKLSLPAIINLHSHPDPEVRQRAYRLELSLLDSVREPLAACLNGVKGAAITLNRRRGREDALASALDQARIDRPTLEAMLTAMQDSFPTFRRYFLAKARKLDKDKLAWFDLFAPLSRSERTYTFSEARQFILDNFAAFSPGLQALAQRAFENHWIDAEMRDGKRGGAFCMGLDLHKESRVLCNFDESLDQVSTIAHELGHAFHNECAYAAGKTALQQDTPMTLAETASIMCETIIMQAVLTKTTGKDETLAILDTILVGQAQVIVDIYSRFLFEKEVFERREKAELSADDLCEIMERAQRQTYGEALDETQLNKYMWAWKPHYYRSELSFYNFPYAFGLLFGTGLYAIYQQRGPAFVDDYTALLASTGEADAVTLAARFGIDIRQVKFWEDSLAVIAGQVERYCGL